MSNSVDFDASKGVEKSAADVVLEVFWAFAVKPEIAFCEFRELVETWMKIREMEAPEPPAVPDTDYKKLYFDLVDSLLEEDAHPAPGPEEVQIDQHTFVSKTDAEAEIEAKWFNPEKKQKSAAKSAAGKSSFARRKQAALEAVKSARASGCTLQGIADQSNLSLTMVMDLINGVSRPVTDWTKLEKGLKKLGHPPRVIPKEEPHEQEQEE